MISPVTFAMLHDARSASIILWNRPLVITSGCSVLMHQLLVSVHCVILVLFAAPYQTSAAVTTSPATTDTTAITSATTGLQSSIPGN